MKEGIHGKKDALALQARKRKTMQNICAAETEKHALLTKYTSLKKQYTKKIISPELYAEIYSALFGKLGHKLVLLHYDSEISRLEQELLQLRTYDPPIASSLRQHHISPASTFSSSLFQPLFLALVVLLVGLYALQPSLTGYSSLLSEAVSSAADTQPYEPLLTSSLYQQNSFAIFFMGLVFLILSMFFLWYRRKYT